MIGQVLNKSPNLDMKSLAFKKKSDSYFYIQITRKDVTDPWKDSSVH